MKTLLSVLLLGLASASVMSCKSPKAPEAQAGAQAVGKPVASETPAPAVEDQGSWQSSYWERAMSLYKPSAEGDFATTPEESETPPAAGTTAPSAPEAKAPTPTPIPEVPPATKPPPLKAEELPFGTRIPGQPGLVKSPYDAEGRSVDVRDFAPGQMARCPYSGKVFRVPPK